MIGIAVANCHLSKVSSPGRPRLQANAALPGFGEGESSRRQSTCQGQADTVRGVLRGAESFHDGVDVWPPLGSVIVAAADQLIASTRPSVQTVLYTSQVSTEAEYITIIHAVKQA